MFYKFFFKYVPKTPTKQRIPVIDLNVPGIAFTHLQKRSFIRKIHELLIILEVLFL